MSEEFPGYKGEALKFLKKAEAEIGEIIRIPKDGETYEGILIPRSEYRDEKHVVIKLKSELLNLLRKCYEYLSIH